MNFQTPISQLTRVGKTIATRLERLGIKTAEDLLFYFPFRYEDYSLVKKIEEISAGETVTVRGEIEVINNRRAKRWKKNITEALVTDESGSVRVVWFNQPFITKTLLVGDKIYLSGKVKMDMLGPQFVSPSYEKVKITETTHTARLVPIYPLTAGITEKQMRFLVSQIIELAKEVPEWLPENILEKFDLVPLADALKGIHFPVDKIDLDKSTERLKFDELFLLQMKADLSRRQRQSSKAPIIKFQEQEIKEFVSGLPFELTKPQKVSAWEILQDIEKNTPMNRLLSGDVGSGKTVVGAVAIYDAILNGYQAVLMAPTEILATQHYESIVKLLGNKVNIALVTHSQFLISPAASGIPLWRDNFQFPINPKSKIQNLKSQKKELLKAVANGEIQIIIGTHALLSEGVEFKNLGLVIVDEQHRFGVEQRKLIKEKGRQHSPSYQEGVGGVAEAPTPPAPQLRGAPSLPTGQAGRAEGDGHNAHFLSMTATPIPRSLALVIYGDLDVSVIDELPPGRKKVMTRVVDQINRKKAYDFIENQVKGGRQVFVVCPLIQSVIPVKTGIQTAMDPRFREDDNEMESLPVSVSLNVGDEKKTVMSEYKKLSEVVFPKLKVGYLHGKMKSKEKEEVMANFKNKKIDILVATSVVEVGVDIPNASVMMIEGAERFGLAQLHQFRGRVGRSVHQSYCFLFTDSLYGRAKDRLKFFETENNGFKLAEKDLEIRGPGEVYGTAQSGLMNLRLAKLTDTNIIKKAREASKLFLSDPNKYPKVLKRFKNWEERVHLE